MRCLFLQVYVFDISILDNTIDMYLIVESIFKDYDYYALLVKIDERSTYETDNDKDIGYILLSKQEMSDWIERKSKNQSGMINCYVQYLQDKNSGSLLKVMDSREHPMISLKDFYRRAMIIEEILFIWIRAIDLFSCFIVFNHCSIFIHIKGHHRVAIIIKDTKTISE